MSERPRARDLPPPPADCPRPQRCPHCGEPMVRMVIPELASFDSPWIYVCFNDDCGYFRRSGEWMQRQYASSAQYRHKLDPFTGETGPLPVWSADAMRNLIVEEDGE
ncbi:MAG: hypothetical protein MAG453_00569 [Calditrichaeota bacterium]|nr:hypothetical protein [Calditrichota bacterium]